MNYDLRRIADYPFRFNKGIYRRPPVISQLARLEGRKE